MKTDELTEDKTSMNKIRAQNQFAGLVMSILNFFKRLFTP